ncbi:MAG: DNA polymerase III subunit delta' [Chloroflexota bacterium]
MWNTIGHEWAVAMLARAAATQPSHAYLFVGQSQIGKLTLAMDFARALNCTGLEKPCDVCRACKKIADGQHPDVRLVRRLPDKSEILVEQLRELQNELALKPYEGRWRIAVIENVHEANANAANAFLKTLEEPNPQVVILLTAHNPEAVLATIRSRCQIIPLRPLPIAQVEQALRARNAVTAERAQLLARLSGGRIGWALESSDDEELLAQRDARLQELLAALSQGRAARIELAGRLTRSDDDVMPTLDLWLSWWRDLLLVKGQCADAIVNVNFRDRLARDAERLSLPTIQQYVTAIHATRQQVDQNVNARLAVEVMLLTAPTLVA